MNARLAAAPTQSVRLRVTPSLVTWLLVPMVAVAAGLVIGAGYGPEALAVATLLGFMAIGLVNWRYSVYGLLLYLPFSGIPIIASYPETGAAVLVKDALFVIPAYVGFALRRTARQRWMVPDHKLLFLLVLLTMLVLGHALNPSLPNRLVAVIGIKVWLLYIPLWLLGYQLVRDRADLGRVLGVMSLAAVLPALIGLIEAVAIYSGREALVYGFYGQAASAATQDFAELAFADGGTLRRVPSTFTFVAQYFTFTVSMLAITYAWWRGVLVTTRWSPIGFAIWMLVMFAGLLSGARAAFFFVPMVVMLMLLLNGRGVRLPLGRLAAAAIALPLAVGLFGARLKTVLSSVTELGDRYLHDIFIEGLGKALRVTAIGLGTGIDTNASRHAVSGPESLGVDGVWYESWYVKALLELGLPGLLLVTLVMGTLIVGGVARHRRLRDPKLRAVSAALLAFLVWGLVSGIKGQYLDIDPGNVYFWLFAGILAAIPRLDRSFQAVPEAAPEGEHAAN